MLFNSLWFYVSAQLGPVHPTSSVLFTKMAHFELTGATRRNNMRNVALMGYAAARSPNAASWHQPRHFTTLHKLPTTRFQYYYVPFDIRSQDGISHPISSGWCKFDCLYVHIDNSVKRFCFRQSQFFSGWSKSRTCIFSLLYFNNIL
jgi:hypothetical protein